MRVPAPRGCFSSAMPYGIATGRGTCVASENRSTVSFRGNNQLRRLRIAYSLAVSCAPSTPTSASNHGCCSCVNRVWIQCICRMSFATHHDTRRCAIRGRNSAPRRKSALHVLQSVMQIPHRPAIRTLAVRKPRVLIAEFKLQMKS